MKIFIMMCKVLLSINKETKQKQDPILTVGRN